MCGFAGIFSPRERKPMSPRVLGAMTDVLAHRGPDDEGVHIEPGVALGFRRLSIVDLAGGHQPLSNEDGSIWLVFNGEIYNHETLRRELVAQGHRFRSRSDSEVIVHAYEQWGHRCAAKLRGIFAFAIWDRNERALWLVRDQSGIKPLYLTRIAGEIRFASEIKALLVDPAMHREIDPLGYVSADVVEPDFEPTALVGIEQLGAGRALRIDAQGETITRYWRYAPSCALEPVDGDALVERLRKTLEDVVGMQLMADVPIGAYLSGGVDSACVVAAAISHGNTQLRTFTSASEGSEDARFAHGLAQRWDLPCTLIDLLPRSGLSDLIRTIAWMAEGEFDSGYLGRYLLSRSAREQGIKVILTGQGIDEILTGYSPSYSEYEHARRTQALWGARSPMYRGLPPFGERLTQAWARRVGGDQCDAQVIADSLVADHASLSRGLLRFEDRMGMANSVEVRVPLLDHELLEMLAAVPHPSRATCFDNKRVLREAASAWIPPEVANRPKHRFNSSTLPLSKLVLTGGDEGLRDLLRPEEIERRGYFEPRQCEQMAAHNQFFALDHVFIIQLMDELFVSHFPTDSAAFANPLIEVFTSADLAPWQAKTGVEADDVLALNPAVFGVVTTARLDLDTLTLPPAEVSDAVFSQADRATVPLNPNCLVVLAEIDGRRSCEEIYAALQDALSREDLFDELARLVHEGVLMHRTASDKNPAESLRSNRLSH